MSGAAASTTDAELSLRDLRQPLAAVVGFHVVLMLLWSVVVPTFRAADEHVHHDFLRHLTETWDYPEFDELRVSQRTLFTQTDSPVYPAHAPAARADQATPRGDRSSWTELGADVRDGPFNQLAQHPPLYYVPTAAVLRVIDGEGTAPVDRVVWQLRLLNILTLAPLPLLAADIARRLSSSRAVVVAAAAGIVAVPQLTHIGATLSNDPPMIVLGSVALAGAVRMLTGDTRWSTAAVTGVSAGLALLTKGFAVPLVPAIALAALLPLWHSRSGRERGAVVGRGALVAGLALVFGGWWWIRNIVVHGNPQPGVRLRDRVEDVDVDVVHFAGSFTKRLVDSFWGNFGWREAHIPIGVSAALTVVLVALVAVACWRDRRRLVLVVPVAVAGLMVLSAGWGAYKKTGVSYATQGRYLFAAIAAVVALAAIGAHALGGRFARRHLAVLVLGTAATLQLLSLAVTVARYWAGAGLGRLEALVEFSPLEPPVTVALIVLPVVVGLLALVTVARDLGDPSMRGWSAAAGAAQRD